MTPRHVVLVGLPGAGKSTAGKLAARELGVGFTDLDQRIEAGGRSVPEIMSAEGEARFREIERDAMKRVLAEPPQIIAPGGGWAAQPGNLEEAVLRALVIHLQVSPYVASLRLGDAADRPLLSGGRVLEKLTEVLGRREKYYRRAEQIVSTERKTPQEVATAIVTLARRHAAL